MAFGYQVLGFGSGAAAKAPYDAEYLIVAGGASSGKDAVASGYAGGGGAGGYRTNFGGTAITLTPTVSYTITVGTGGAVYGPELGSPGAQ